MSLETHDTPPQDKRERLDWHVARMLRFFNAARQCATNADDVRAQWRAQAGQRRDIPDRKAADLHCSRSPVYIDLVAQQQMYDRWCTREASVVQALSVALAIEETTTTGGRRGSGADLHTRYQGGKDAP